VKPGALSWLGRCAALGTLLLTTSAGTGTADATVSKESAANGRIVFVRSSGEPLADVATDNIYSVNPDGTGLRQLTSGDGTGDSGPLPSPNGRLVAFSSKRAYGPDAAFKNDIWIMRADGSGLKRLTEGKPAVAVSWSPDGKRITYEVGLDNVSVWTMNADGTGKKSVSRGRAPNVSPDGTKVIRTYAAGGFRIADLKTRTVLPRNRILGYGVVWAPNSKRLLFHRDAGGGISTVDEIWIANADGTGVKRLTNSGDGTGPSWAPDGRMIAFMSTRGDQTTAYYHLFVMRPDGSGVKRVTSGEWDDYQPAWSAR
jgi:TolB protein